MDSPVALDGNGGRGLRPADCGRLATGHPAGVGVHDRRPAPRALRAARPVAALDDNVVDDSLKARVAIELRAERRALLIAMNDLVIRNVVVIPVVARRDVTALANKLHAPLSGWDKAASASAVSC